MLVDPQFALMFCDPLAREREMLVAMVRGELSCNDN